MNIKALKSFKKESIGKTANLLCIDYIEEYGCYVAFLEFDNLYRKMRFIKHKVITYYDFESIEKVY